MLIPMSGQTRNGNTSCHEEILRISRMVGDLEKLAKFEGENLLLHKTTFDVSLLITNILTNFAADFKNKGIEINFYGAEEPIHADKDKISQVIINLISNALKYTPKGGSVELRVKSVDNMTQLTIKDSGAGIPDEDLPYIFERFYRADKSRNRLTGGSGIGLTIVEAIVGAHKGKVSVTTQLNKGTEFTVLLPKTPLQDY